MNGQNFWNEEWIRLLKTKAESEDIRVLTLWQPWASFVALGFKQIETKGFKTNYRGKLLIQSAVKSPLLSLYEAKSIIAKPLLEMCLKEKPDYEPDALHQKTKTLSISDFPSGCILAIADLTDCKIMDSELIAEQSELELAVGSWMVGRYAWKLENIIAAPTPIPYKNGQGLQRLKIERLLLSGQEAA